LEEEGSPGGEGWRRGNAGRDIIRLKEWGGEG
jgi:hypothetical protein